jgi:hypothetical protein
LAIVFPSQGLLRAVIDFSGFAPILPCAAKDSFINPVEAYNSCARDRWQAYGKIIIKYCLRKMNRRILRVGIAILRQKRLVEPSGRC